jgi:phage-related protein
MSDVTGLGTSKNKPGVVGTLKNEAAKSAQEIKDKAADMTGVSTDLLKEHANKAIESAKELASETGEKISEKIADQKNASADYAKSFADTLRRAAGEFDDQVPLAGRYIRTAADQVEAVSNSVRNGNVSDLVNGAQDFARRQPTAFLGLTVLAGFGLVRFLKSSGGATSVADHAKAANPSGAA